MICIKLFYKYPIFYTLYTLVDHKHFEIFEHKIYFFQF